MKITLIVMACMCVAVSAQQRVATERPNILFIMSDDHATQAIGAYGSRLAPLNPTPVIDRLATEGMLFENAYCNNSICTPSRASILTGQYPQTNGVLDLTGKLPPAKQYLPVEMKKAGYQTAMVGKWHLTEEPAKFDYYYVLPGQGDYINPSFHIQGPKRWPGNKIRHKGHSSDIITDVSLDWLKTKRDKSKPFFLMHQFKAPHSPFTPAPRYSKYLENVNIPEPASLYWMLDPKKSAFGSVATRGHNDSLIGKIGPAIGISGGRQEISNRYQKRSKDYLRCVKGIDDNIKRLLDYLQSTGELDNTIVIYTSDQGYFLGEHGWSDKRFMYEESMRMPLVIRYPKMVKPGSRSRLLVGNSDFAPTLINLAGGSIPGYMQGRSFATELKGETPGNWRDALYYRYWMHGQLRVPAHFGIRTSDYKLIFFYGRHYASEMPRWSMSATPVAWELYDMKNDPQESTNLYGRPEYDGVVKKLKQQLAKLREELNETDEKFPEIQKIIDDHWDD
jgi:N-acetylglucosamine-6-sulfatase